MSDHQCSHARHQIQHQTPQSAEPYRSQLMQQQRGSQSPGVKGAYSSAYAGTADTAATGPKG